jgi:ribosomal protein L18E
MPKLTKVGVGNLKVSATAIEKAFCSGGEAMHLQRCEVEFKFGPGEAAN